MEEIKVFHSLKRNALLLLACVFFVCTAVFAIIRGKHVGVFIVGILFFGGAGLYLGFLFLKERLTGKAYLVISDESLTINTFKERVVLFSDVSSFNVAGDMICINYKKGKRPNHKVIKAGRYFLDPGDSFLSVRLTQKPDIICAILNNRVKAASNSK